MIPIMYHLLLPSVLSLDAPLMKAAGYNATGTQAQNEEQFLNFLNLGLWYETTNGSHANFGKKAGAFIGGVIGRMLDRGYGFTKGKLKVTCKNKGFKKKKEAGEDVDVSNDPRCNKITPNLQMKWVKYY